MDIEAFYEEYWPRLSKFVAGRMRKSMDDPDVRDVLSATALKLVEKWDTYHGRGASRYSWACRIAINEHLMSLRRAATRHEIPHETIEPTTEIAPADVAAAREDLQKLKATPDQWQVIHLRAAGWSIKEIAERLGLGESAVKSRLWRFRNSRPDDSA